MSTFIFKVIFFSFIYLYVHCYVSVCNVVIVYLLLRAQHLYIILYKKPFAHTKNEHFDKDHFFQRNSTKDRTIG